MSETPSTTPSPLSFRPDASERQLLESVTRLEGVSTSAVIKRGLKLVASSIELGELNRMPLYPRMVDEEEIDDAVEAATSAACEVLDELMNPMMKRKLPELNGISSNFQGLLADHIRAMLTGATHAHRSYQTNLTPLFAKEATFGRLPSAQVGQGFLMVRPASKVTQPDLYFDDDKGWVEISRLDIGSIYTSPEAATQAALKAMKARDEKPRDFPMRLVLVDFSGDNVVPVER